MCITKDKNKSLSFHLLLVGNSGTMCSEFPSREKSGGVGVDPHLWRMLSSSVDQKDESDFGASYIPFGLEDLYSSVLGTTTQHRPDNDQVKCKYSEAPFFFVKCLLYLVGSQIEVALLKKGLPAQTISPGAQ